MKEFRDIRITPTTACGEHTKALVSLIVADYLHVREIRIIEGSRGLFLGMPSKKTSKKDEPPVYLQIVEPVAKDIYSRLAKAILDLYKAGKMHGDGPDL